MAKVSDAPYEGYWFELWIDDQRSMQETMLRNMTSDLDAGYSPYGNAIMRQVRMISERHDSYIRAFETFKNMTEKQVDNWCFHDLLQRGAIA